MIKWSVCFLGLKWVLYTVLINTLWREGKTDEAVSTVQEMEQRGIVGSAALYYDLARCLCSAGRCQEALMLVLIFCLISSIIQEIDKMQYFIFSGF